MHTIIAIIRNKAETLALKIATLYVCVVKKMSYTSIMLIPSFT